MRASVWAAPIAWMALILWLGSDSGSTERTGPLIMPLLRFLFPASSPFQLEAMHSLVRKLGHLTEYAILAASFIGNAERVAEVRREYELRFGLPVAVVRVDWGGSQWRNRVYVGSYTDRSAAERARRILLAQGLESDSQVRSMANVVESTP